MTFMVQGNCRKAPTVDAYLVLYFIDLGWIDLPILHKATSILNMFIVKINKRDCTEYTVNNQETTQMLLWSQSIKYQNEYEIWDNCS